MNILTAPPAPLPSHTVLIFLLQLALLLGVARLFGWLAERCGMPAVAGELLTGVLLGPSLLGHLMPRYAAWLMPGGPGQIGLLDAIGQLGVLLLVAVTGSHVDLRAVRRRRSTAAYISVFGLVVPLGLGIAAGFLLPRAVVGTASDRGVFVLFLGVAMCVSAIPVIAKTLTDMRLLHRDVGQLTLAAGMVDDAVGWFLLSLVSAAATVGVTLGGTLVSVLSLLGFSIVVMVAGGPVVRGVLRISSRSPEPGTTIAVSVLLVLLGAVAAHGLKLEPVFGAFIVGILIGTARARDLARLAPLRTVVLSVFAPLFLATAGLRMDLTALRDPAVAIAAVVILAVAVLGKFAGAYAGARLSRLGNWEALAIGAGMNARGVIEVIVATTGLRLGILNTATYTIVILVAVMTSLMAPPLLRLTTARIEQSEQERARRAHQDRISAVAPMPVDA
ncbi:cation:proton antiporter [Dactylosporangium sp. CA-139066]|uniref:cation:proton antiporter n=1 Tax=Dactylosporangium sp. CA-139066 TaxID=3239930 RepID=UPI003D900C62